MTLAASGCDSEAWAGAKGCGRLADPARRSLSKGAMQMRGPKFLTDGTFSGLAPGKAWGRGIDARRIVKPFVRTLRESNPSRQSLASSRKRVLRPVRVTGGAKRRQPALKPRD